MSAVGGKPIEARVELGRCRYCGTWVRGRWRYDLTAYTAVVEHCPGPDQPPEE